MPASAASDAVSPVAAARASASTRTSPVSATCPVVPGRPAPRSPRDGSLDAYGRGWRRRHVVRRPDGGAAFVPPVHQASGRRRPRHDLRLWWMSSTAGTSVLDFVRSQLLQRWSGLASRRGHRWRNTSRPGSPGRAGGGLVARGRPRLRPADGARAAPVHDRAAPGRARRPRRGRALSRLLHRPPRQRGLPLRRPRAGQVVRRRHRTQVREVRARARQPERRVGDAASRRAGQPTAAPFPGRAWSSPSRVTATSTG